MKLRKVITLDDIYKKRYDLGSGKYRIVSVELWGYGNPDEIADNFPPLVSAMDSLTLKGKFKVAATARLRRQNYFQLIADGEYKVMSTYLEMDIDSQQILDTIVALQITIDEVE